MSIHYNRNNSVGSYTYNDYLEYGIAIIELSDGSIKQGGITFDDINDNDTDPSRFPCNDDGNDNGAWYSFGIPLGNIWTGQGDSFQPFVNSTYGFGLYTLDENYWGDESLNEYTPVEVETNWIILETVEKIKDLVALRLSFDSVGNLYPDVKVSVKNNYYDKEKEFKLSGWVDRDNMLSYDLRSCSGYKFLKLNLSWKNTNTKYISALNTMSIVVKQNTTKTR